MTTATMQSTFLTKEDYKLEKTKPKTHPKVQRSNNSYKLLSELTQRSFLPTKKIKLIDYNDYDDNFAYFHRIVEEAKNYLDDEEF